MTFQLVNATLDRVLGNLSHSNWIPRKASSGVQYVEPEETDISVRKRKPVSIKPQASGPSETHVTAQKTKSKHPSRRLPPVPSNGEGDNTDDIPPVKLEPTSQQ